MAVKYYDDNARRRIRDTVYKVERANFSPDPMRRKRRLRGSGGDNVAVKRYGNMTYWNNDGFLNGKRYVVDAGGGVTEAGETGMTWHYNAGSQSGWWTTSNPGLFYITHEVRAIIPFAGWAANCDPSSAINVAKPLRCQHRVAFLVSTSGGGGRTAAAQEYQHTNTPVATYIDGISNDVFSYTVSKWSVIDAGDQVTAWIEGYQWPVPGDMVEWGGDLARMTFARANDNWVAVT